MQQIITEEIVKLQPKWLLTLPSTLREGLFEDKGYVRVKKDKGRLIIEPVRILDYPVRKYTSEEVDEFFALDDAESKELRKKDLL